jgi:L-fucose isomerase-like protein
MSIKKITRRNFLEVSTLAATGLSFSGKSFESNSFQIIKNQEATAIDALNKISSAKLVCVGPANSDLGGWLTFEKASELFGFKTTFYSWTEFINDFNKFLKDETKNKEAKKISDKFVSKARKVIEPTEEKLLRAGIYYLVMKEYVEENKADWITVNCFSRLFEDTKATPCMSNSILNDSGIVATCEADFTAGPLHYLMSCIAGKPSFFIDPAVNEGEGTIILAHCTSPTKLLGYDKPHFPYDVRTHHETNLSATPKPVFEKGVVTVAGFPEDFKKMLIIRGQVIGSPDLRICRSQVEVKVNDAEAVLNDWQGFHWSLVYGDYVKELEKICKEKEIVPLIHV